MFAPRYFAPSYFSSRYWGEVGTPPAPVPPVVIVSSGGGKTTYRVPEPYDRRLPVLRKVLQEGARERQRELGRIRAEDDELLLLLLE